jgi:predicted transcriptional regulator
MSTNWKNSLEILKSKVSKAIEIFSKNPIFNARISAESLIQMLKSELSKSLRQIEMKFKEIKKQIPPSILKMKVSEVRLLNDLSDEILIEEKMTNLNVTIKETVQKVDEGKSKLSNFGALGLHLMFSHLSIINTLLHSLS